MSENAFHKIVSTQKGGDNNQIQVVRSPDTQWDLNAVALSGTPAQLADPAARTARLMGGSISVDAQCSVLIRDDTGVTLWRTPVLLANQVYNFDLGAVGKRCAAVGSKIQGVASTGTANITGTLYGCLEG